MGVNAVKIQCQRMILEFSGDGGKPYLRSDHGNVLPLNLDYVKVYIPSVSWCYANAD